MPMRTRACASTRLPTDAGGRLFGDRVGQQPFAPNEAFATRVRLSRISERTWRPAHDVGWPRTSRQRLETIGQPERTAAFIQT